MVLTDVGHGVVVGGGEVPDVEVTLKYSRASARSPGFPVWRTRLDPVFEWLCMATGIWCFAANGTMRLAASSVADAVMISAPSAVAISKPRPISAS